MSKIPHEQAPLAHNLAPTDQITEARFNEVLQQLPQDLRPELGALNEHAAEHRAAFAAEVSGQIPDIVSRSTAYILPLRHVDRYVDPVLSVDNARSRIETALIKARGEVIRPFVAQANLSSSLTLATNDLRQKAYATAQAKVAPTKKLTEDRDVPADVVVEVSEAAGSFFNSEVDRLLQQLEKSAGEQKARAVGDTAIGKARDTSELGETLSYMDSVEGRLAELKEFMVPSRKLSMPGQLQEAVAKVLENHGYLKKSGEARNEALQEVAQETKDAFLGVCNKLANDVLQRFEQKQQLGRIIEGLLEEGFAGLFGQFGRAGTEQTRPTNPIHAEVDAEIAKLRQEGLGDKAIYRQLVRKYHPDSSKDPDAAAKFSHATNLLSPPVKQETREAQ